MKDFVKKYKNSKIPPDILIAEKIDKLNED